MCVLIENTLVQHKITEDSLMELHTLLESKI